MDLVRWSSTSVHYYCRSPVLSTLQLAVTWMGYRDTISLSSSLSSLNSVTTPTLCDDIICIPTHLVRGDAEVADALCMFYRAVCAIIAFSEFE